MTDNITPNLTLDEPAAPSLTLEQEAPAQPDGQTQAAEALKPRGADALAENTNSTAALLSPPLCSPPFSCIYCNSKRALCTRHKTTKNPTKNLSSMT